MRIVRQKRTKKDWKEITDVIQTEVDDNTSDITAHDLRIDTLET